VPLKDKKPEPQWVTRQQFLKELIKEVKKMSPEEKAQARKNLADRLGVPRKAPIRSR
jgi:ribosomal protein L18E